MSEQNESTFMNWIASYSTEHPSRAQSLVSNLVHMAVGWLFGLLSYKYFKKRFGHHTNIIADAAFGD